jgi:hypothetical protein
VSEPAADPYATFLRTADTGIWQECLDRSLERVHARAGQAELAEALCIAAYLIWLGRSSGATATEQQAWQRYRELNDELVRATAPGPSRELDLCWGIVLAFADYRVVGATLLQRNGQIAPEHLLLALPSSGVRTVAALRPLFDRPPAGSFLPAAHIYGLALANIGAVHEARELIARLDRNNAQPLLLEVLGVANERLGLWPDADTVYRRSPWPLHRYRAAMVGAIAGRSAAQADELELDEPTLQLVGQLEGELDQTEITRSVAFLSACVWQPVTSWLVETELGKLNFRRRRHAEADLNFQRALQYAPGRAQFAVSQLRFANFTWLTGTDPHLTLNMAPEALTVGRQALACSTEDDDTSNIRIWLAQQTNDLELIPESLEDWDPYQRGEGCEVVGERGRALDCWLESLREGYYHRAVGQVLNRLRAAGFPRAAGCLAEVVLRESWEDFPALLETAEKLQDVGRAAGAGDPADELVRIAQAFQQRLIEMSKLEFKNAIRCYALVRRAGQQDLAEGLLLRLAKQAEGVSELLAAAVLRRSTPMTVQAREEGLWCVRRALTEARDRSERLQIAREFFHYGQIGEARTVLRDERVLLADQQLSHADMTVLLQCAEWLTRDELQDLADRAIARLLADQGAGVLGRDGAAYGQRLLTYAKAVEPQADTWLSERIAHGLGTSLGDGAESVWRGASDEQWPAIQERLDSDVDELDAQSPINLEAVASPDSSFGLRLSAVEGLRTALATWVDRARQVHVEVPQAEIPLSDAEDRGDRPRTIQLSDLWRAHLTPQPDEEKAREAAGALRAFFEEERLLRERWNRSRQEAAAPRLRRAVRIGEALLELLPIMLGPAERNDVHPIFRDLFAQADADVATLATEVTEQVALLRRELEPVFADGRGALNDQVE